MPITQTPIPLSDEWATPKWLFDHFDAEFGFTLDGAAQPWNAKCARFYTPYDHNPDWCNEVVWLNPPYSELGAWMWKADLCARRDGATVVCLVPCVPDRKWWSEHVEDKAEVRPLTRSLLPSGRVHFEKEDGTSGRAPFPSAIIVFRPVFPVSQEKLTSPSPVRYFRVPPEIRRKEDQEQNLLGWTEKSKASPSNQPQEPKPTQPTFCCTDCGRAAVRDHRGWLLCPECDK